MTHLDPPGLPRADRLLHASGVQRYHQFHQPSPFVASFDPAVECSFPEEVSVIFAQDFAGSAWEPVYGRAPYAPGSSLALDGRNVDRAAMRAASRAGRELAQGLVAAERVADRASGVEYFVTIEVTVAARVRSWPDVPGVTTSTGTGA